jgi:hypothetical protein
MTATASIQNTPTVGQVQSAIRRFTDYSHDLMRADMNTFGDRIQNLAHFCEHDSVFGAIHQQLVNNPAVNFDEWLRKSLSSGTGWAGSCKLIFPINADDRLSLLYQFFLKAADPEFNVIGMLPHWFVVGSNRIDAYISAFIDAVLAPLFRELGYKFDEVEMRLPTERTTHITPDILRILAAMPVHIDQSQTFNFKGSATNVQIGNSNSQVVNYNLTLTQILERIDASDVPEEKKKEAKSLLAKFLEHPLVSTVVGSAVSAALG